jgi:aspartate aminotransferase-like enzyme
MKKYYLMAPGPSMIPERILLEMAKPIIHHRTKAFEAVIEKVRRQLKMVFQTKNEVLLQASVGSGGMEAAIVNCFSPGDKVLCVRSGKFGERWGEQAATYGLTVVNYDVPWGEAADVHRLDEWLTEHKDAKGVLCQACETSTGVAHPVQEMGELLAKKYPQVLFMVDAITALGIYDIRMDAWNIDVLITGSQKAMMLPPGLAMFALSDKAWKAYETAKLPRYYFDADQARKAQEKNQTYFTPAISLIQGLSVALDMIEQETLAKLFARHRRLANATRAAVKAMGLELFSKKPSDSITAVVAPDQVDGEKIVRHMSAEYNVTIIGGQDHLKGRIFRLGHMGYCGDFDILAMIGALEMTLKDLGCKIDLGKGVAAATAALYEGMD